MSAVDFLLFFLCLIPGITVIWIAILAFLGKAATEYNCFNWSIDEKICEKAQRLLPELQLSAFSPRVSLALCLYLYFAESDRELGRTFGSFCRKEKMIIHFFFFLLSPKPTVIESNIIDVEFSWNS